jgi:CRP-like cAMP-binding protein
MDTNDTPIGKNLEAFFTKYQHLHYKQDEILIRAEDDPIGVYCLNEGIIKQYIISEKGDELITNFLSPFSVFPLYWVFNNTPNIYFYETLTPVGIWRALKEDFLNFVKHDSEALISLISLEIRHTERLRTHVAHLIAGSVHKRLIENLIFGARIFGKEVDSGSLRFEFKITERELASLISTAPETISRELRRLKDKGLVTFDKNILIISDIIKMEKELLESE